MKRGIGILVFILLVNSLYSVSAISSDLKTSYEKGETIIAEISGDILGSISDNQIEFRRGHVLVPFDYEFKKLGGRYFLWAIAPENENNYSLVIKNIATTINGKTQNIDFVQNFSVIGNLTDYVIKPGFVSTKSDFSTSITLNGDVEKKINIDFPLQREILLKPGKNSVDFSVKDFNKSGFFKINIGKYVFIAYITNVISNSSSTEENISLRIEPSAIVSTVFIGDKTIYPLRMVNFGNKKIDNIYLAYNKKLFAISRNNISIEKNSFVEVNLSFIGDINDEFKKNGVSEFISFNVEDKKFELPVIIAFTENKSEAKTPYLENKTLYYCSELKGIVCSAGEQCEGDIKASVDGVCCVGNCSIKKDKGTTSWWGYIIALALFLLLIYIFIRYRKTKNRGDIFSKKVTEAENKMNKLP